MSSQSALYSLRCTGMSLILREIPALLVHFRKSAGRPVYRIRSAVYRFLVALHFRNSCQGYRHSVAASDPLSSHLGISPTDLCPYLLLDTGAGIEPQRCDPTKPQANRRCEKIARCPSYSRFARYRNPDHSGTNGGFGGTGPGCIVGGRTGMRPHLRCDAPVLPRCNAGRAVTRRL